MPDKETELKILQGEEGGDEGAFTVLLETATPFDKLAGFDDKSKTLAFQIGTKYSPLDRFGKPQRGGGVGGRGDTARHLAISALAKRQDAINRVPRSQTLLQLREHLQFNKDTDTYVDLHNNSIAFMLPVSSKTTDEEITKMVDEMMERAVPVKSREDIKKLPPNTPVFIDPDSEVGYPSSAAPPDP